MPDASHDFGGHLRQAREQKGISLRQIADRTKISVPALEALERNDISRLPGGIFTRAFVRAYAVEIDLDPEDTVRRFLARFPDESSSTPVVYEANPAHIEVDEAPTFGRAWRTIAWSFPILLVVAYFGFGGRLPLWRDQPSAGSGIKPVPKASVPVPPPPAIVQQADSTPAGPDAAAAQASVPPSPDTATSATPGAPSVPTATATPQTVASIAPASSPAPGAAAAPLPQAAAVPAEAPPGSYRLTLAPREACWVSVRVNGASVFSQLMRPGERRDLTLTGEASVTVGNAGALAFLLNDQPGRSLGGPGQVVTAKLNPDNLKSFLEPR